MSGRLMTGVLWVLGSAFAASLICYVAYGEHAGWTCLASVG